MQHNTNVDMNDNDYRSNLRHMAEPASPSERDEAVSISLENYQALYLATMLREWAAYHADDEEQSSIARGYVEYINREVRQNGDNAVHIYSHTPLASDVITDGLYDWHEMYRNTEQLHNDLFRVLEETVIDLWGGQHAEQVNKDAGRKEYDDPPERLELQVGDGETVEVGR